MTNKARTDASDRFPNRGGHRGILVVWSSLFIVDEREKALVLQFGQIKAGASEEPGSASRCR